MTSRAARRTRLLGAAGAVLVVGVVAVVAVTSVPGAATDSDRGRPTVAGAVAAATATPDGHDPAAPGATSGASSDLPVEPAPGVQEILDLVTELEAGVGVSTPAAPDADVEVAPGVRVALVDATPVDGQAAGPGEASGPALALTVRVVNDSGAAVSTDGVVVNVYGDDGVPGSQLLGDPRSAPLQGDVAGGTSAQGVYVLTGPGGSTAGPFVVSVSLGAGTTTALVVITPEAG